MNTDLSYKEKKNDEEVKKASAVSSKSIQLIYYIIAAGGLIFGYSTAIMSGARELIGTDLNLTLSQEGMLVSSLLLGAVLGSLVCTPLAEQLGRKKVLLINAIVALLGTVVTGITSSYLLFVFFRLLLGISIGGFSGLVPMYLSELAPSEKRGQITSINSVLNVGGMFVAYIVNYVFFKASDWRVMLLLGVLPAIAIILWYRKLPESPKWLIEKRRFDEAQQVAQLVYGAKSELATEPVTNAIDEELEKTPEKKFQRWMLRPVVLSVFLALVQQLCGANSILYFAPTILARVGFGESTAMLSTIFIGAVFFIFIFVSQRLIDKVGRKLLLLVGNVGMAVSIILLGWFSGINDFPALVLLGLVIIFIMFYSVSWCGVVWAILGEIIPTQIKGFAMGFSTACLFGSQAILSWIFPTLIAQYSIQVVFYCFGIINVIAFLVVLFYLAETKGKTLDEIEFYYKSLKNKETEE
ncbi:sugar porter family MFS transporter [Enterococcus sp. AZ109]|uniref:sugar porter family MFS transporter n=1 Tax=Enterococcus sp. AZ109 TaxID=2774634 RepID=UPI003F1EC877